MYKVGDRVKHLREEKNERWYNGRSGVIYRVDSITIGVVFDLFPTERFGAGHNGGSYKASVYNNCWNFELDDFNKRFSLEQMEFEF